MVFRPATPGFIVTLLATILLGLVSFNVPIIKSLYFLKATLTVSGVNGTLTLGTLGYCLELSTNGTTCSSPKVGYEFDPNALLGNSTSVQIPNVVVRWLTYVLFLHVIAFCGAGVAALFGLLSHVREMSMTCCSSFLAILASSIASLAFIFDIVVFFVVKKRVDALEGSGGATFGNAVWMTLASVVLLVSSSCCYACGRCCIRRRPRSEEEAWGKNGNGNGNGGFGGFGGFGTGGGQAEQMRLDAIKAEQERKARQRNEVGLPAFPDRSEALEPLKEAEESEDEAHSHTPYRDHNAVGASVAGIGAGGGGGGARRQGSASTGGQTYRGGYAQAPPGTRAVDEYYVPSSPARSTATGYPPNRQYTSTPQSAYHNATPAVGAGLAVGAVAAGVGVAAGGAGAQLQGYPSAYSQYSQYDPYYQPQQRQQSTSTSYNAYSDTYNQTGTGTSAGVIGGAAYVSPTHTPPPRQPSQPQAYADPYNTVAGQNAYTSTTLQPQPQHHQQQTSYYSTNAGYGEHEHDPYSSSYGLGGTAGGSAYQSPTTAAGERSYTLGGGGYGANVVPDSSGSGSGSGLAYGAPVLTSSPPPMPTANVSAFNTSTSGGVGALNSQPQQAHGQGQGHSGSGSSYEDAPPGYDASGGSADAAVHVPAWGSKGGMHLSTS